MNVEWIFFDWGGTLAQVVTQEKRLTLGARQAAEVIAGMHATARVEDLIARVLRAEEMAAVDPEHREADPRRCLREWAANLEGIDEARLEAAAHALGSAWIGSLEAFAGILDTLRTLQLRGYRMGLVSNCMVPPPFCDQECSRLGLAELLNFCVFSSAVGFRKPSRHIYQHALTKAFSNGQTADPSRVLFVGDSPAFDVIAPAEIGMKTALVKCQRGIWPAADYARARPDLSIDSVNELLAILH